MAKRGPDVPKPERLSDTYLYGYKISHPDFRISYVRAYSYKWQLYLTKITNGETQCPVQMKDGLTHQQVIRESVKLYRELVYELSQWNSE
jgi:hypothetical protein